VAKTRSLTIRKFDVYYPNGTDGEPAQTGYKYNEVIYDKDGHVVEELRYTPDGIVEEKNVYRYNNAGRLVEEQSFMDDGELADHKTYEHDDNGKILRMYKHYIDGSKDTVTFTYDEKDNLLKKVTEDSDDEEEAREEAVYENGKLISRKAFEYDDLVLNESFEYDENGQLTEQNRWSAEEEDITYKNFFNENGDIIKTLRYADDKLIAKTEYRFNDQHQMTAIEDENRFGKSSTRITFDDKGNPVRQEETNEQGEINSLIQRKYDTDNRVIEAEVQIDYHGRAVNQHYILKYDYESWDES